MTSQLKAQTLDVIITGKTPKTITYDLSRNGQSEKWKIPQTSKFDTSTLVIGERYVVKSKVVVVKVYCHVARKVVSKERYDWVLATVRVPDARLEARSAKQRGIDEQLALMPMADNGSLFKWP